MRRLTSFFAFFMVQFAYGQSPTVGMTFYEDAIRNAQTLGNTDIRASLCIRPIHFQHQVRPTNPFALRDLFGKAASKGALLVDSTRGPWLVSQLVSQDSTLPNWLAEPLSANTNSSLPWWDASQDLLPSLPVHYWSKKHKLALSLLPYEFKMRYNTHHPYGWQDGPMIPNVGLQTYQSFGIYTRWRFLEAQWRPERVAAQNLDFENPPIRRTFIDMPDRFGTTPYAYQGRGQSYIKANFKNLGADMSTENLWWGPGRYSSLLMSNNAPGFLHATIHSNKPFELPIGKVEFQVVGAQLNFSGYYPYPTQTVGWPPRTLDIQPNATYDGQLKNFSGLAANFEPKWFPGLYLGVNRVILFQADSVSWRDLLALVAPVYKVVIGEDGAAKNQIVTAYFRYLFPESNAEIYGEYGREDGAWDFEDLISDLEHTRAYLLGFRKFSKQARPGHYMVLDYEMTEISQGTSSMARAYGYSWYTHGGGGYTSYTHLGQVLGAGAGPGSSIQTGGLTYITPKYKASFHLERYEHDKEAYYYHIKYLQLIPGRIYPDISKRWVDFSAFFGYEQPFFGWVIQSKLQVMRTWNFNWNYDPNATGGRFRHPGLNATTLHLYMNAIYRF